MIAGKKQTATRLPDPFKGKGSKRDANGADIKTVGSDAAGGPIKNPMKK